MIVCLLLVTTAFFIENALHMHVPLCMSPSSSPRLPLAWNQTMKMASCQRALCFKNTVGQINLRRWPLLRKICNCHPCAWRSCLLYDCTHIILLHVLVQLAPPRPNQTTFCLPFPWTCDEFSGTGLFRFPIVVLHARTCWHQLYFSIASCADGTSFFLRFYILK